MRESRVKFWMVLVVALGIGLWLGTCAPEAAAQTKVVNPRTVEFNPLPEEYPQVLRTEIAYFLPGAAEPFTAPASLGHPPLTATGCGAPAVDPCVRTSINTQLLPFGFDYIAKVRVVALVGAVDAVEVPSEWSLASNFFDRKPGAPSGLAVK